MPCEILEEKYIVEEMDHDDESGEVVTYWMREYKEEIKDDVRIKQIKTIPYRCPTEDQPKDVIHLSVEVSYVDRSFSPPLEVDSLKHHETFPNLQDYNSKRGERQGSVRCPLCARLLAPWTGNLKRHINRAHVINKQK